MSCRGPKYLFSLLSFGLWTSFYFCHYSTAQATPIKFKSPEAAAIESLRKFKLTPNTFSQNTGLKVAGPNQPLIDQFDGGRYKPINEPSSKPTYGSIFAFLIGVFLFYCGFGNFIRFKRSKVLNRIAADVVGTVETKRGIFNNLVRFKASHGMVKYYVSGKGGFQTPTESSVFVYQHPTQLDLVFEDNYARSGLNALVWGTFFIICAFLIMTPVSFFVILPLTVGCLFLLGVVLKRFLEGHFNLLNMNIFYETTYNQPSEIEQVIHSSDPNIRYRPGTDL